MSANARTRIIEIDDHATIGNTLFRAAERYSAHALLAAPANAARAYHSQGHEISFGTAAAQVRV